MTVELQLTNDNDYLLHHLHKFNFGDVHIKHVPQTDFYSIIAIHNTNLGPSLGGCRIRDYRNLNEALNDVMQLAQAMSYKAALAGLPLGGGKAVIFKPQQPRDRNKYFTYFGKFVEELNGRYITAVDSGTSPEDMEIIAKQTKHVTSLAHKYGDPSPTTAIGVLRAIEAAVKFHLKQDSLKNLRVCIQGVGKVGEHLARALVKKGAKLTLTDIYIERAKKIAAELNAEFIDPDEIFMVECDVFAPCALGGILNDTTIPKLRTTLIVGAANNQLSNPQQGLALKELGILYVPDYLVNAGGLIYACGEYFNHSLEKINAGVENIYQATLDICERAKKENLPTNLVADKIAQEKIAKK